MPNFTAILSLLAIALLTISTANYIPNLTPKVPHSTCTHSTLSNSLGTRSPTTSSCRALANQAFRDKTGWTLGPHDIREIRGHLEGEHCTLELRNQGHRHVVVGHNDVVAIIEYAIVRVAAVDARGVQRVGAKGRMWCKDEDGMGKGRTDWVIR